MIKCLTTLQTRAMDSFNVDEIKSWGRFYRANFINSLTGFKAASLIGTVNKNNQANLAIFSSIVHLGSDPALIGFINRPVKSSVHTLSNIKASGVYTINHIHESFISKAHQTSARYEEDINEFEEVRLTPEYLNDVEAPFVKESHIKYALQLEDIIPIKINDTFLVIGKLKSVHVDSTIISSDGFLNIDKAHSICSNGLDAYYKVALMERFSYAKPGVELQTLNKH